MKLLRTLGRKPTAPVPALRRRLEALEDRTVPTTITIVDANLYEGSTAIRFIDDFVSAQSGGLDGPKGLAFHNGQLFVTSSVTDSVERYDGLSGHSLGSFVTPAAGGLDNPFSLTFGPDGSLYVSNTPANQVLRYDGATGAFLGEFVAAAAGGLNKPRQVIFGPDGNLYVASERSHQILRYQGPGGPSPGTFLGEFAATGSGTNPFALAFGPDGNLFVACTPHSGDDTLFTGFVNRYDGSTGTFLDTFVPTNSGGLKDPRALVFDPEGNLYVSNSFAGGDVLRYQGPGGSTPGAFLGVHASPGDVSLGLAFDQDANLYVGSSNSDQVLRYGPASQAVFTVRLDAPSATQVTVQFTTVNGTALAGTDYTAAAGTVTFSPGQTTRTILVRTFDDGLVENAETFVVNLSNAVGATIADGQATGTIVDDDATKFFVVNDGGPDRTYRYGAPGNALGNSTLTGGNTTPRGAASTAAGTKVWVVDANKTVYVYDPTGALLGSWTANGLPSNAQVEGITSNGTDIWIADNAGNKVYRYAGAASRLSGSQSAASSFNLNISNSNAKDLVTDGASIWVVNDASTDKVFKYTLTGSLLGSWTIASANAQPTGITLDPANVAHLWIVDAGADKVFQYDNAVGRTSGSQSAAATFALASGNTNPQGIADPPMPAAVAPPLGLVSWWTADDTANDLTGLNNPVLVNGTAYAAGQVGSAFDFNGTDGRVQLDDSDSLKFTASMTIEGWIRVDAFPIYGEILFRGDDRGGLDPYSLVALTGGTMRFAVNSLTSGASVTVPVPGGQLIHVAATLDDATGALRVYVNGAVAGAITTAVRPFRDLDPASNPSIAIGNHGGYPTSPHNQPFNGLIDELAVYDRALTAAEVQAIVAAGSDGKIKGPNYFTPDFPSFVEGAAGTTAAMPVTIRRVGDLSGSAVVNWATADSTAAAGSDYVAASGQVVFQAGESQTTVQVTVLGDDVPEPDETFRLVLSTAAPGFAVGWSQANIVNDDAGVLLPQVGAVAVNGGVEAQRSRVTSIVVTFNAAVTFAGPVADAFALARIGGGPVGGFTAMAAVVNGVTVVTLSGFTGAETQSGSLADGRYAIVVRAAQVSSGGQPLDGNGDGLGGDDYTLTGSAANGLFRLFGDATGDGFVNAADFAPFRGAFGSAVGQPAYLDWLDVDGDGFINAFDFAKFRTRFGASVP